MTPRGHEQASWLADNWPARPELIVYSPYVRTRLTAAPMLARYPLVPHEEWPVHEFTFLTRGAAKGTTIEDRKQLARPYWAAMDPMLELGDGGESFACFHERIAAALARAARPRKEGGPLVIFTHNRVLLLLMQMVMMPPRDAEEAMRRLYATLGVWEVGNCGVVRMLVDDEGRVTMGRFGVGE